MTPVRLLALDLDDTLLRSDLSISARTKRVLRKAEKAGVVVVLASGRAPKAMTRYARELGMHKRPGYLIANNGVSVLRSDSGAIISEGRLPREAAILVYELVEAEGLPVQIYKDDTIYVSRRNEFGDMDIKLTGFKQLVVKDFKAMVASGQTKLVIPSDPAILRPLETLLRSVVGDQVTLCTSKPYFLEVLPPKQGKGEALALIATELGIKKDAVMALGDSMNDESMIRWAGWGVAMRNGDERIKAIASFTSELTNEDDGAADIIQRFILGDEVLPPPRGVEA